MNPRIYVIIEASDVDEVRFEEVMESAESTLRWNIAGTQTFVKFEGDTPDFLDGKTQHSHSEIKAILVTPAWSAPHDPE